MADSQPTVLQGVSPDCQGSVGFWCTNVLVMCRWDHKAQVTLHSMPKYNYDIELCCEISISHKMLITITYIVKAL